MPYARLSEQVQKLSNPQGSDAFIKQFRNAVRDGEFDAADLPEGFTLLKDFKRRGEEGTYQRDAKDMIFEVTPAFEKWFEDMDQDLSAAPARGRVQPKVTLENIESGAIDFKALAEETRRKLQASFEKGQALGNTRKAGTKVKPKRTTRSTKK